MLNQCMYVPEQFSSFLNLCVSWYRRFMNGSRNMVVLLVEMLVLVGMAENISVVQEVGLFRCEC